MLLKPVYGRRQRKKRKLKRMKKKWKDKLFISKRVSMQRDQEGEVARMVLEHVCLLKGKKIKWRRENQNSRTQENAQMRGNFKLQKENMNYGRRKCSSLDNLYADFVQRNFKLQ